MLTLKSCERNNLCVDCNEQTCLRKGDPEQDCPKYHCDNTKPRDCKHCDFLKEYTKTMRTEYLKTELLQTSHTTYAKKWTLDEYNRMLQHIINVNFKASIEQGLIYTTDELDEPILECTIIHSLNQALCITVTSIHPENDDTIWLIYKTNQGES